MLYKIAIDAKWIQHWLISEKNNMADFCIFLLTERKKNLFSLNPGSNHGKTHLNQQQEQSINNSIKRNSTVNNQKPYRTYIPAYYKNNMLGRLKRQWSLSAFAIF